MALSDGAPLWPGGPTARPIDFSRSHAVLLGVSDYGRCADLHDLPAARNSLRDMEKMLLGPACGWPRDRVHTFTNLRSHDSALRKIAPLIRSAEHTLFFYYVGHGLMIDGGGDLGLTLADISTTVDTPGWQLLPWSHLRAELDRRERARGTDVILLDCCYSGHPNARTMGPDALSERVARAADTEGAYVLTASRYNEEAVHEPGKRGRTYFAKILTEIVQDGIPGAPQWLTLPPVYEELRARFAELRDDEVPVPRPTRQVVGGADRLVFARNVSPKALPPGGGVILPPPPPVPGPGPRRVSRRQAVIGLTAAGSVAALTGVAAWFTEHSGHSPSSGSPSGGPSSGSPTPSATRPTGSTHPTATTAGRITRATPLGAPLIGHIDWVQSLAFSPAGQHLLASASKDGTIRLWDVREPADVQEAGPALTGHAGSVGAVAFRPRGTVLAGCGRDTTQLWDTGGRTPQAIGAPLDRHTDAVNDVAFSPDGNTMATVGDDLAVKLWDTTDPTNVQAASQPLFEHTKAVEAVAFSPNGRMLASGGFDNTIRLWNVSNSEQPVWLNTLRGHHNAVLSVAFSPDGTTLASAGLDGTILLWNLNDSQHVRAPIGGPVPGQQVGSRVVAYSSRSVLAAGGTDATVQVEDVRDPARPRQIGHPLTGFAADATVVTVAFGPDGTVLAAGSTDGTIRLWRLS